MMNPARGIFSGIDSCVQWFYASNGAEWYIEQAGKNGLGLCGDATWEGISRSIACQWCGQPRRVVIRRDCIFKTYWTQEFMPQKIHFTWFPGRTLGIREVAHFSQPAE